MITVPELEDLRSVEAADVYKGERRAGTLTRQGGDIIWSYLPDYLADESAPGIARSLPRDPAPVVRGGGAAPAFFAGLLPEGVRLRAVVLGTRTSEDDHLTLLMAVGEDAIGDVRIVPAGEQPGKAAVEFDESQAHDGSLADVFAKATSTDPGDLARVALPGVQVKVSAQMVSAPVTATSGPAILKLNPASGYPRLVENEHFFLRMADACGLPTPPHRLVRDRNGQAGLLVARFDRAVAPGGRWTSLAQEDACQLLDAYPAAKYRLRTEDVATALADTVEDGDGSRTLALSRTLELVAFSYLIGNGDLHGKNFSAHQTPTGFWEVTPAYDLVSTQPYLSWRDPMALDLYGRANRLTRGLLAESGKRLGLPVRALTASVERICDAAPAWIDRLDEIGFDTPTTERLAELIQQRLRDLRRP